MDWLNRTESLIGKDNIEKLNKSHVVVFGLGGVGSYVVEGLVRAGIGNISIIDNDIVDITNINRQLIANTQTIGKPKVDIAEYRALTINPQINISKVQEFVNKDNINDIMSHLLILKNNIDYVVDAIDTTSSKLEIIKYCYKNNLQLISCMGTGNKLDPTKFEITDINKTSICPLAKIIRKELRNLNISHLQVLYSKEVPQNVSSTSSPASISFVPSVAGLIIAGKVVNDLIK